MLIRLTSTNAEKLLEALRRSDFGTASLKSAVEILRNEITIFADRVRIDVQTRTPGLDFDTAWRNRIVTSSRGRSLFLVSKPDLIASKRARGRDVGLQDIRALEAPSRPRDP